jgi:hypothetical protein
MPGRSEDVKDLRFHRCLVQCLPCQVLLCKLSVRSSFGLFGNRKDRRWAVDGLRSAGDVGQPIASKKRLAVLVLRMQGDCIRFFGPVHHLEVGF